MIYLDHSATCPISQKSLEILHKSSAELYGNPSGLYQPARKAAVRMRQARRNTANILGCLENDIIYTSGATESNNLAILGTLKKHLPGKIKPHVIISALEHPSVLKVIAYLRDTGKITSSILKPDKEAIISPEILEKEITKNTALVSITTLCSETGTVQPIRELALICRERSIPFHTDCAQAFRDGSFRDSVAYADLITFSSHKNYGPKGIGILAVREKSKPGSILFGGDQEDALRPGTENIPGILALEAAMAEIKNDEVNVREVRDKFRKALEEEFGENEIAEIGHPEKRGGFHSAYIFKNADAQKMIISMDLAGICISSGSACSVGSREASPALLSMGISEKDALSALRFTFGESNTLEEIPLIVSALRKAYDRITKSPQVPLIQSTI